MGRYSRKKKRKNILLRAALSAAAAVLIACGGLSAVVLYKQARPSFSDIGRNAAVFSALYSMPDRTLEQLHRRFADKTEPPDKAQEDKKTEPTTVEPPPPKEKNEPEETDEAKAEILPGISREIPADYIIPDEYTGEIIEEDMSSAEGKNRLAFGQGVIKNSTSISEQEIMEHLAEDNPIEIGSDGPQVLIMHTHATESFEPYDSDSYDTRNTWRSTDNNENIVAAGEAMAEAIRAHGIEVLHDTTQHDYPSYNGSYERSAATVNDYLEKYPSIKVVLDVHRDAVQRETTLVKPIAEIKGRKAAQLMIIAGCDDGTMDMPNWNKNLRFAAGMQDAIETEYPGLTRPVFFCYRKYNQDLTNGSLLIEIGSHGNTLDEVVYTASLSGDAIGKYLSGLK